MKQKKAELKSLFMFQELIQGNTPVGVSGNLRQSFTVSQPIMRGQSLQGEVATQLLYGIVIERGRRPNQPISADGRDAIELWVRRKLGITENSEGVAFVIARSIARKGFKGRYMVQTAFEDGTPNAIKLFDNATQEAVKEIEKRIETR